MLPDLPAATWLALGVPKVGASISAQLKKAGGAANVIETFGNQIRAQTGIDLQRDVFDVLGDMAFFASGTTIPSLNAGAIFDTSSPADGARLVRKLAPLVARAAAGNGTKVAAIPGGFSVSSPQLPGKVEVVQRGNKMAIVYGGVDRALNPDQTLAANPDFRDAATAVGAPVTFFLSFGAVSAIGEATSGGNQQFSQAKATLDKLDWLSFGGKAEGEHAGGQDRPEAQVVGLISEPASAAATSSSTDGTSSRATTSWIFGLARAAWSRIRRARAARASRACADSVSASGAPWRCVRVQGRHEGRHPGAQDTAAASRAERLRPGNAELDLGRRPAPLGRQQAAVAPADLPHRPHDRQAGGDRHPQQVEEVGQLGLHRPGRGRGSAARATGPARRTRRAGRRARPAAAAGRAARRRSEHRPAAPARAPPPLAAITSATPRPSGVPAAAILRARSGPPAAGRSDAPSDPREQGDEPAAAPRSPVPRAAAAGRGGGQVDDADRRRDGGRDGQGEGDAHRRRPGSARAGHVPTRPNRRIATTAMSCRSTAHPTSHSAERGRAPAGRGTPGWRARRARPRRPGAPPRAGR